MQVVQQTGLAEAHREGDDDAGAEGVDGLEAALVDDGDVVGDAEGLGVTDYVARPIGRHARRNLW